MIRFAETDPHYSTEQNCHYILWNGTAITYGVKPGADLEASRINYTVHEQPYWLCFS